MPFLLRLARFALLIPALIVAAASASAATVPLASALDSPDLAWTTGGAATWTGQTTTTHDGTDAAFVTGLTTVDSETWLETTLPGPGVLTWQWRLDASADRASDLDLLTGEDTVPTLSLTETTPWTAARVALNSDGPIKVRWRFRRDADAPAATLDTAFLDTVAYARFGPLTLQSPTGLTATRLTVRWNALADATAYAVEFGTTADFSASTLTDQVDAPATSVTLRDLLPATTYHYQVVAYGPDVISVFSATSTFTTPALQRPANDAFVAPAALAGVSGSTATTNLDASTEAEEPAEHRASVWFTWTAPTAGRWRFTATSTALADGPEPSLFAYLGSTLDALASVASSENDPGIATLEFDADAAVTYRLALSSPEATTGPATLAWQRLALYTPPANDAFAAATVLSGPAGVLETTNLHATAEATEPAPASNTVWFRWTAPASGLFTVSTVGSAIPTTLATYSGTALGALTLLATDGGPADPSASFLATAGTTYRVVLDGQNEAEGNLRLAWSLAIPTVPQTITFPALPDTGIDAEPFVLQATSTSGLDVVFSVVSGPATLDAESATLTLTGLSGVVTLRASQPGNGTHLPASPVTVSFTVRPPPANDSATTPTVLSGASGTVNATLLFATTAPGDPFPARHSIWFRWTAPALGIWAVTTTGGATPATVAVLAGPSPDELDLLAGDSDADSFGQVSLPVNAGQTYYVSLDSHEPAAAAVRLTWNLAPPSTPQTISVEPLPNLDVDAAPFSLTASATSELPVTFALVSGPATLDGDVLSPTGRPGLVTLRATQPGDAVFLAAPPVTFSFSVRPPPANDTAANAIRLSGATGTTTGTNLYATTDASDPYPASRSVWWRWTAPAIGTWKVDTSGGAFITALTVLAGPSLDELELVAADARPDVSGRVSLPVTAGTVYYVALDSLEGAQGAVRLAWSLDPPSLPQTITFDQDLPNVLVDAPGVFLYATVNSDLPILFTASGPAALEGDYLSLTGAPGTVTLRATQSGDATRLPAPPVTRTFSVTKPPKPKITLKDLVQPYTGAPCEVSATVVPAPRFAELEFTYNGSSELPIHAGTYAVVATADDARATGKLVITKANVVVTALDQRKLAGQDNPAPVLSYDGFLGTDDETTLDTAPARRPATTSTATKTSPAGTYPIRPAGASSPDYNFTYVQGKLLVDSFAGRYEALLLAPDTGWPAAKLEFTIAASGADFTGKLHLPAEPEPLALKGTLVLDSTEDTAAASLTLNRPGGTYTLALVIPFLGDFTASLALPGAIIGTTETGQRVFVPAPKETLAWSGAHTLLLTGATPAREQLAATLTASQLDALFPWSLLAYPAGASHATAAIDAKGNLVLLGRLADGTPLTATLPPDHLGAYRLWVQPLLKRAQTYLAGPLDLAPHPTVPNRRYLSSAAGAQTLLWQKAPAPTVPKPKSPDAAYRAGFGPLLLSATLDPWLPPAPKKNTPAISLPQRLRLTANPTATGTLQFAFTAPLAQGPADQTASTLPFSRPPTAATLSPALSFTPLPPAVGPTDTTAWKVAIVAATGAISGSFTVSYPGPTGPAAKPLTRVLSFTGVLRQSPSAQDPLIGGGVILFNPNGSPAGTEQTSAELRFTVPAAPPAP